MAVVPKTPKTRLNGKKGKYVALRCKRGKKPHIHIFQAPATAKETHCVVASATKHKSVYILVGKTLSEVRKKAEKRLRLGQPYVACKLYSSREAATRNVCWSLNDLHARPDKKGTKRGVKST